MVVRRGDGIIAGKIACREFEGASNMLSTSRCRKELLLRPHVIIRMERCVRAHRGSPRRRVRLLERRKCY